MVAEFMLQQTRAEFATPYFDRWVAALGDWRALAAASREDVLRLWAGLGYYARARNLHRSARIVCEELGGALPRQSEALLRLPGVGPYTAAAVASIAFGEAVAAIDGNVRRVLCRLMDWAEPTPRELREVANRLLDPLRPGDFNEAMMELGATICAPKAPECERCPISRRCIAHARGTALERGKRGARPSPRRMARTVAVALDARGRTLIVKREGKGLLGGMWEFPGAEAGGSKGEAADLPSSDVARAVRRLRELGVAGQLVGGRPLATVRHRFTHLDVEYRPCVVLAESASLNRGQEDAGANANERPQTEWIRPLELSQRPLSAAQKKIGALLVRMIAESESAAPLRSPASGCGQDPDGKPAP